MTCDGLSNCYPCLRQIQQHDILHALEKFVIVEMTLKSLKVIGDGDKLCRLLLTVYRDKQ